MWKQLVLFFGFVNNINFITFSHQANKIKKMVKFYFICISRHRLIQNHKFSINKLQFGHYNILNYMQNIELTINRNKEQQKRNCLPFLSSPNLNEDEWIIIKYQTENSHINLLKAILWFVHISLSKIHTHTHMYDVYIYSYSVL